MSLNSFGMYVVDFNGPAPASLSTSSGGGVELHGSGPPSSLLGNAGDTYVDDDSNGLYWKSASGWNP